MVIRWILLLTVLFPSVSLAAPALSERDWQILKNIARNGGAAGITLGTSLPVTCTPGTGPNAFFLDTNTGLLSFCATTDTFTTIPTSITISLDGAFDNGAEVDGATNANPLIIGNGTQKGKHYGDASKGYVIEPVPLGDSAWRCWTDFNCIIRDEENSAAIFTIDPDAASKNAMYQFGSNYKPLASIPVTLYPRGAASYSEASIVTNQPKSGWIQITDADTDAVDFRTVVTGKMAAATTATLRLYGVSDHATPSGNIVLNCAIRSNRPGTDTYVAHSTTGEQAITLTPATQNRPVSAVTSAITINGTVAEFAEIEGSCEVNAASTTSAQLTDFFLRAEALLQLSVNSWSD